MPPCQGFPLVLDGEIKVARNSGDGRSLELYRVVPGELCLVSSACLFRTQPLSARQGLSFLCPRAPSQLQAPHHNRTSFMKFRTSGVQFVCNLAFERYTTVAQVLLILPA